jgi:imidazolonepropionase-like amidohydrolase
MRPLHGYGSLPSVLALAVFTVGCAGSAADPAPTPSPGDAPPSTAADASDPNGATSGERLFPDPFPSTYQPLPSESVLIRNGTVLTGAGERIQGGDVLIQDGKIQAVGPALQAPPGVRIIDATGRWVTPGIIDTHSHLGVYPSPGIDAVADGNEMINPNTADAWAEHGIWPQDPGFGHALAGGVTAMHILPGSANLFGGRGVTLKNVPSRTYQGMKFPGAPHGLKMACGENPKRVYGGMNRAPYTRMGNISGARAAWIEAEGYRDEWRRWRTNGSEPETRPQRDLVLETLAAVLEDEILVQNHCYRADEMAIMLDMAREFGYRVASFHHAVEAYKIRDLLQEHDVCASVWADWWGFKLEAYDGILENAALIHADGGCAVIHSDSPQGIQRLNQETAKVLGAAAEHGIEIPEEEAIRWITSNAARAIGIHQETGTLAEGMNGDVVIWSSNPFSVYAKAEKVFLDGALLYDRSAPDPLIYGDFILGILPEEAGR